MKNEHILDQSFEAFLKVQFENGAPPPDELSFVGGFMTCFGIITGRVTLKGIDQEAPLTEILEAMHKELYSFGQHIIDNQRKQADLEDRLRGLKNGAKVGNDNKGNKER